MWHSFRYLRCFIVHLILYVRIDVQKVCRTLQLCIVEALLGSSIIDFGRCRNYFTLNKGTRLSRNFCRTNFLLNFCRHGPIGWLPMMTYGIPYKVLLNTTFGKEIKLLFVKKFQKYFICSVSDVPLYSFSQLLKSLGGISDSLSQFCLSNTNGELS